MICPPLPSEHPPTPQWDHTIIRSVCAGHDFPIHDAEGVSLWFSGQRLLTDGTSENLYRRSSQNSPSTHLGEYPREEEARFGGRLKGNVCNEVGGVKRSADPRVGYETSDRTVKRARSTTSTTPGRNPEKEAKEDGHEDVRRLRDQAGGRHSEAGCSRGRPEGGAPLRDPRRGGRGRAFDLWGQVSPGGRKSLRRLLRQVLRRGTPRVSPRGRGSPPEAGRTGGHNPVL